MPDQGVHVTADRAAQHTPALEAPRMLALVALATRVLGALRTMRRAERRTRGLEGPPTAVLEVQPIQVPADRPMRGQVGRATRGPAGLVMWDLAEAIHARQSADEWPMPGSRNQ